MDTLKTYCLIAFIYRVVKKSITKIHICNGFKKTGIHPYNRNAITEDDLSISRFATEKNLISEAEQEKTIRSKTTSVTLSPLLPLPKPIDRSRKRKSSAAVARLFDVTDEERPLHSDHKNQPSTSGLAATCTTTKHQGKMPKTRRPRNDICSSCGIKYEGDTKGGPWFSALNAYAGFIISVKD